MDDEARQRARERVLARARERSGGDGADSNWEALRELGGTLTALPQALGGLAVSAGETTRSVLEMPGTLGVGLAGRAMGLSDEEIAAHVRDTPGLQWVANEEAFDPVTDRRARFDEMFPLFGHVAQSYTDTGRRLMPWNWDEYGDAYNENRLPNVLMEDILNVTSIGLPASRGAQATARAAEAGAAGAAVTRVGAVQAADRAVTAALAGRPELTARVLSGAGRAERAMTLGERGAFLPALPYRALAAGGRGLARTGGARLAAVEAAAEAGVRASLLDQGVALPGRAVRGMQRVQDKALAGERMAPVRDWAGAVMGRRQDMAEATIGRLYRVAERRAPGVDGPAVLFALSRAPDLIAPAWQALDDAGRQEVFSTWREQSPIDLTYESFTRAMEYRDRALPAADLARMDQAATAVREAGAVLDDWYVSGEGVTRVEDGAVLGATPEDIAFREANVNEVDLANMPDGTNFVLDKVSRQYDRDLTRAATRADRARQAADARPAPAAPDPGYTPPDLGMVGYDRALRSVFRREQQAGRIGEAGVREVEAALDTLNGEARVQARRALLEEDGVGPAELSRMEGRDGRLTPEEVLDGVETARQIRADAQRAAEAVIADIDSMSGGGRVPFVYDAWTRGQAPTRIGGPQSTLDGAGWQGTAGHADAFVGWTPEQVRAWNRFAGKATDSQIPLDEVVQNFQGWRAGTQSGAADMGAVSDSSGQMVGAQTAEHVAGELLRRMEAYRDLELIASGRAPRTDAWQLYLGDPDVAYIVQRFPESRQAGAGARSTEMWGRDVTYRPPDDGPRYGPAFPDPKDIHAQWGGPVHLRRLGTSIARARRHLDAEAVGRVVDRVDEGPVTARAVARREELIAEVQRKYGDDFEIGARTKDGYGSLTPGQKRLYRALETAGRRENANYRTRLSRRRWVQAREKVIDQARRQAVTAERAGIRSGERFGREAALSRQLERSARRAENDLGRVQQAAADAYQAEMTSPSRLGSRYRPAVAFAQSMRAAFDEVAAQVEAAGGDATSIRAAGAQIVDTTDRAINELAVGDQPVFLAGGVIDDGVTGLAPISGRTPRAGRSRSDYVKQGDRTPLTFRGQAILVAQKLKRETENQVVRDLDSNWAVTARTLDDAGLLDDAVDLDVVTRRDVQALVDGWAATAEHPAGAQMPAGMRWVAWDPGAPLEVVRDVTADTRFLPEPVVRYFRDQFRDPRSWEQALYRALDRPTGIWKDAMLAFSAQWQLGNIATNMLLGATASGVSIVDLIGEFRQEYRRLAPEPNAALAEGGPVSRARYARQAAHYQRGQQVEALRGELPTELGWASGVDPSLSRYTRDVLVSDPTRGSVVAAEARAPGRWRRGADVGYGLAQRLDDASRAAIYSSLARGGMSDAAAIRLAIKSMPDSRLRPWERQFMRRVFPFFMWMKHMTLVAGRLSRDHPMRVAWTIRLAEEFQPDGSVTDLPLLAGAVPLGGDLFMPGRWLNPYGDIVNMSPEALGGNVNPFIKLGLEAFTGQTLDESGISPLSRPPGTGAINAYGSEGPLPLRRDLGSLAYRALGMTRQTATARDALMGDVARYDSGDPIKRTAVPGGRGREVERDTFARPLALGARFVGVPFPVSRDVDEIRASRDERVEALRRRRESYYR